MVSLERPQNHLHRHAAKPSAGQLRDSVQARENPRDRPEPRGVEKCSTANPERARELELEIAARLAGRRYFFAVALTGLRVGASERPAAIDDGERPLAGFKGKR